MRITFIVIRKENRRRREYQVIGTYPSLEEAEERILRDDGHSMSIYACEPSRATFVTDRRELDREGKFSG